LGTKQASLSNINSSWRAVQCNS